MTTVLSRRVLIIDDDSEITGAVRAGLERFDHVLVTAFNDPVDAVNRYRAGDYDIVLLDFQMPGMNGFEVCRRLRAKDKQVKICFLTAFDISRHEFALMFPDISIDAFLTKPVTSSTILRTIDELVPGAKMSQHLPLP